MIPPFVIYLVGAGLLAIVGEKVRKYYAIGFALLGLLSVLTLKTGMELNTTYIGFNISYLYVDKLSLIVGYAFSLIGLLAVIYSFKGSKSLQISGLLYTGCAIGAVFAGDFLTLYIFWELVALTGAALIFLKKDEESRKAGLRYLYFHIIGGVLLLGGIMFNYMDTHNFLITKTTPGIATTLMLLGIGVNCAFVLLHTWLPDSYPKAPFMASVFLSVYTTKTAVYMLARTSSGLDFVAYMGAAMAVFGVCMALMQNNARKLLSYHIISQVGYMVAAIGIGTAIGINGGIFHLFNHIFYKALLFMTIGAIIYKLGEEQLTDLGGLFRKMPFTATFAVIASLSIAGFPLFNGFASKHMIFEAAHGNDIIYLLLELAAVGTALSFLKFCYFGFFRKTDRPIDTKIDEAHPSMLIAMGSAAFVCVLIGVYPALITNILPFAAEAKIYEASGVIGSLLLFGVTIALFFVGLSYFEPHKRMIYDFDVIYIKVIDYLYIIPRALDWINNLYETAQIKVAQAIKNVRYSSQFISDFISNTVFAFFIDMWYVEKSDTKPSMFPEKTFSPITIISKPISIIGDKSADISAYFDAKIIDRFVNLIAATTNWISEKVRKLQTGSVQLYAVFMVIALLILILLTKGGR